MSLIKKSRWKAVDPILFGSIFILSAISVSLLISASSAFSDLRANAIVTRQSLSICVGLVCFTLSALMGRKFWQSTSLVWYLLSLVFLAGVLVAGESAGGASRWLSIGGIRFQPSEFSKIGVILFLAYALKESPREESGLSIFGLWKPLAILLPPFCMILLQPDLGTALCHGLIAATMVLVYGVRRQCLIKLFVIGLVMLVPAWNSLHSYQQDRIRTFLKPEADPLGEGYHAMQSKIAIGSGRVFGKGFREGTQTQLRFLPEQTTDFIFSVLAEEWGLVGSLAVLSLYALILLRLMSKAFKKLEMYEVMVLVGTSSLIFWHVVVNIGMATGLVPVVGLTLPILSFGGSSVVNIMLMLGIASGVMSKSN